MQQEETTYPYDDDFAETTCHCVLDTLDEFRPYTPVDTEGTKDHHKGIHEYCAEAIIVRHIVQYKWDYNRAVKLCNALLASYTCYLHAHFKVDVEGHVTIKILVQSLKTGCTAKKDLELYFPKDLFNLFCNTSLALADEARSMPCSKCGKTGFEHRESHYSKAIKAHTYDWGGARPKVYHQKNPKK